jgi:hypothetical protein
MDSRRGDDAGRLGMLSAMRHGDQARHEPGRCHSIAFADSDRAFAGIELAVPRR